jgi:glycogen synthase
VSARRRVLMTTDAVGGVWTYAVDLAAALEPLGFDTALVVLGPSPTPEQAAAAAAIPRLEMIDTRLPLDWTASEPADVEECGAALRGLARRIGADLIHLNSPVLAIGGFDAPVVGVCHSCVATWWSAVRDGPMPQDFVWRSRLAWRGLLACHALIAPTAAFAQATARAYDLPTPFVVHNGRAPAPASLGPREPIAFTSGRLWDDGKNVQVLDAAAARTSIPIYAAGALAGPNAAARGDLRNLNTLGALPPHDIRAWLDRAAIYASSALYEPFGLGVLEAAQAGCALVLSDIPTFRELWNGVATFIDPRSADAFGQAFERLGADPGEVARLGGLARARAADFTTERMAGGVAEVYALATGRHALAPRREAAA